MDEDHDRMYVGTKDYIVSLDLHNINREPLLVRETFLCTQLSLNSQQNLQVFMPQCQGTYAHPSNTNIRPNSVLLILYPSHKINT